MGPYRRIVSAALIASIAVLVAGCDAIDSIADMSIFDTKKKLPGERKPVFPDGVPGVTQGIPPELQKGYSEQAAQPGPDPATAAVEQLAAKPDPAEKPKPKPKVAAKPKPKPKPPVAQAQTAPPQQPYAQPKPFPQQAQPAEEPAPRQALMPWPTAPQPAPATAR